MGGDQTKKRLIKPRDYSNSGFLVIVGSWQFVADAVDWIAKRASSKGLKTPAKEFEKHAIMNL